MTDQSFWLIYQFTKKKKNLLEEEKEKFKVNFSVLVGIDVADKTGKTSFRDFPIQLITWVG